MIYTAVYGGSDELKPLPNGLRGICYTDDFGLAGIGWDVRLEPLYHLGHPRLRAKFWKAWPEVACPDAEVTVWVDASMAPTPVFDTIYDELGADDAVFFPGGVRDCIYDEVIAARTTRNHIYADQPLEAQGDFYRALGHPEHWGLFAAGCLLRRRGPRTNALSANWWREITRWSVEDQVSLPFVVHCQLSLRWHTFAFPMYAPEQPWFTIHAHALDNPV